MTVEPFQQVEHRAIFVGPTQETRPDEVEKILAKLPSLELPKRHPLIAAADVQPRQLRKVLVETYENPPENFEALLGVQGLGPKTLRALALVAELVYGTPASTRDPARFAFAHGGKDGTPFRWTARPTTAPSTR